MSGTSVRRVASVVGTIAALAGSVHGAPIDDIIGDALVVQATAGSRTATLTIPKTSLVAQPGASTSLRWTSPGVLPLVAADTTVIGTVEGSVWYDTLYDNIFIGLTYVGGVEALRLQTFSAQMNNSFTTGTENMYVQARLTDLDGDGAAYSGLYSSTRGVRMGWNGTPVITTLPAFTAPPGQSVTAVLMPSSFASFVGYKTLDFDFTLSANDRMVLDVSAITAIPAPQSAAVFALAGFVAVRRRR